jgi:putative transposase
VSVYGGVKDEEVYLKHYETPRELTQWLEKYYRFFNKQRLDQALDYQAPAAVSFAREAHRILS